MFKSLISCINIFFCSILIFFYISKIFFSATISENLVTIINNNYADSIKIRIGSKNLPAKNIIQEFVFCSNEEGKITELKSIFHRQIDFPVLVFIDGVNKIK